MATSDVPGHVPENRDELHAGCWAEHDDGSLLVVHQVTEGQVFFSLYGTEAEWPGQMVDGDFKSRFSWDDKKPLEYKWLWHDKTPLPFDWRKVARPSGSLPSQPVVGPFSAASKVAADLKLRAQELAENASPRIRKELKDFTNALFGRLPD